MRGEDSSMFLSHQIVRQRGYRERSLPSGTFFVFRSGSSNLSPKKIVPHGYRSPLNGTAGVLLSSAIGSLAPDRSLSANRSSTQTSHLSFDEEISFDTPTVPPRRSGPGIGTIIPKAIPNAGKGVHRRRDRHQHLVHVGGIISPWRHQTPTQEYNPVSARWQAGLLFLATIAPLVPSAIAEADSTTGAAFTNKLSVGLAVLLIAVYGLGMFYPHTAHHEFLGSVAHGEKGEKPWPIGRILVLGAISAKALSGYGCYRPGQPVSNRESCDTSQKEWATMISLTVFVSLLFLYSLISQRLERTIITAPIVFTVAGTLMSPALPEILKAGFNAEVLFRLSEIGLVLLLFADASRTDLNTLRRIGSLPVRLLSIGMLLTILFGAFAARLVFPDLSIWEAGILAAVLAPTDAGLGQIIVNSPRVPMPIRQALNVEAGLNDGLSVPFLMFFIALAAAKTEGPAASLTQFIIEQLGYGVLIGGGIGFVG